MKNKTLLSPDIALRTETWKNGRKLYVFKCINDSCSNEIRVGIAPSQLKRSTGICTSCHRKGKPFGVLFNRIKDNARLKNLTNTITYEQFIEFTNTNSCTYCDSKIEWVEHLSSEYRGESGYNLDRKDPSKGYSKENCVVCCKICNWSKNELFTHEEFLEIGKTIGKVLRKR